jgi:hypothetical protein
MFNPTMQLIEACVDHLQQTYQRMYGQLEPAYPQILGWAGGMALELIANSDALYHNVEHTVMVTLLGQEILRGKHLRQGGVSPHDWLHVVLALLCHDIGYVRGICREDEEAYCATGVHGQMVTLPAGSTDAVLTPYHVDRGQCFVRERFGHHALLDAERLAAYIERTRFPVPHDSDHQGTADYAGLVRAADLIGQLADPQYLRKLPALFYEFVETGTAAQLGYRTPGDLREEYPTFYWNVVARYIQDGLRHLRVTQEGKQWMANLYAHVFAVEHAQPETCLDLVTAG